MREKICIWECKKRQRQEKLVAGDDKQTEEPDRGVEGKAKKPGHECLDGR